MRKRFAGQFDALAKRVGADYENRERFTPLRGHGKPLWEFKEHDHRLYCHRHPIRNYVQIVLFNGWVKDKKGPTDQEDREVEKAKRYYAEFLIEYPGGKIT